MKRFISMFTLAALAFSLTVASAQDQPKKAAVKEKKAGCAATCSKKDKAACGEKAKKEEACKGHEKEMKEKEAK